MAYVIAPSDCINCGKCRRECPTQTILFFGREDEKHWVEPSGCIDCDLCARACPMDCITREDEPVLALEQMDSARARARSFFGQRRRFKRALAGYADAVIGASHNGLRGHG